MVHTEIDGVNIMNIVCWLANPSLTWDIVYKKNKVFKNQA